MTTNPGSSLYTTAPTQWKLKRRFSRIKCFFGFHVLSYFAKVELVKGGLVTTSHVYTACLLCKHGHMQEVK